MARRGTVTMSFGKTKAVVHCNRLAKDQYSAGLESRREPYLVDALIAELSMTWPSKKQRLESAALAPYRGLRLAVYLRPRVRCC
jgi:hypothetical protein